MLAASAQFVFQALRHPRSVGAVLPSSNRLAIAMAKALEETMADASTVSMNTHTRVIELGPGTGRITQHLPQDGLTLVEINAKFSRLLEISYPKATVFTGSAVDFFAQLTTPCAVVSSIPLLNNPHAGAIRQAVASAYQEGLIQKLITYSYGSHSPFSGCGFRSERQVRYVALNVPPARVWLYE